MMTFDDACKPPTLPEACMIVADDTEDKTAAGLLRCAAAEIDRLQAALAAATEALDTRYVQFVDGKIVPVETAAAWVCEERVNQCFCETALECCLWTLWVPEWYRWVPPGHEALDPAACPRCGAHLGADGIARRWSIKGDETE